MPEQNLDIIIRPRTEGGVTFARVNADLEKMQAETYRLTHSARETERREMEQYYASARARQEQQTALVSQSLEQLAAKRAALLVDESAGPGSRGLSKGDVGSLSDMDKQENHAKALLSRLSDLGVAIKEKEEAAKLDVALKGMEAEAAAKAQHSQAVNAALREARAAELKERKAEDEAAIAQEMTRGKERYDAWLKQRREEMSNEVTDRKHLDDVIFNSTHSARERELRDTDIHYAQLSARYANDATMKERIEQAKVARVAAINKEYDEAEDLRNRRRGAIQRLVGGYIGGTMISMGLAEVNVAVEKSKLAVAQMGGSAREVLEAQLKVNEAQAQFWHRVPVIGASLAAMRKELDGSEEIRKTIAALGEMERAAAEVTATRKKWAEEAAIAAQRAQGLSPGENRGFDLKKQMQDKEAEILQTEAKWRHAQDTAYDEGKKAKQSRKDYEDFYSTPAKKMLPTFASDTAALEAGERIAANLKRDADRFIGQRDRLRAERDSIKASIQTENVKAAKEEASGLTVRGLTAGMAGAGPAEAMRLELAILEEGHAKERKLYETSGAELTRRLGIQEQERANIRKKYADEAVQKKWIHGAEQAEAGPAGRSLGEQRQREALVRWLRQESEMVGTPASERRKQKEINEAMTQGMKDKWLRQDEDFSRQLAHEKRIEELSGPSTADRLEREKETTREHFREMEELYKGNSAKELEIREAKRIALMNVEKRGMKDEREREVNLDAEVLRSAGRSKEAALLETRQKYEQMRAEAAGRPDQLAKINALEARDIAKIRPDDTSWWTGVTSSNNRLLDRTPGFEQDPQTEQLVAANKSLKIIADAIVKGEQIVFKPAGLRRN